MKKFLFLGLVALMAAGISSCSDDAVVEQLGNTTKPLDSDQSFFVNIAVNGVGAGTRAISNDEMDPNEPKFDPGEADENAIQSIYFVFYDENGDRVSTTQVRKENATGSEGHNDSENYIYSGVVQIDVKHGSLPPAYVMAFVNPITATNFEINPDFATLKSLQQVTRPKIIDDANYFAMSKSVYYGIDRSKPNSTDMEKIIATPLEQNNQLFPTKEAALDALAKDAGSVVDIYVERYAAKVKFSLADKVKSGAELELTDEYTLKFVPEYWAVNAYESNTYITKSFFSMGADGTVDYSRNLTYTELNTALGGGDPTKCWYWNSPDLHRCYWAQSPAYYAEKYPRVADDILDKRPIHGLTGGYILGYYSYDEMKKNATGRVNAKARAMDETLAIYARENTVTGAALKAAANDPFASPKAAIPSIVMVGHYEINGKKASSFYVMGNATNGYTLFENEASMRNYFVKTTIPFALDDKGDETFFDYTAGKFLEKYADSKFEQYFVIEHPKEEVRGSLADEDGEKKDNSLIIDSRFVTIQLSENIFDESAPTIYAYLNGEYTPITRQNFKEVNQKMLYAAGTVQGFNEGKAYFTVPIKHLGFSRTTNLNKDKNANDKTFNWQAVQSGDFGLVRNHVYSIIVEDIKGLGNGIPDPGTPIVPPTDPEEYFIGARLIILNWAVVPTQHETL